VYSEQCTVYSEQQRARSERRAVNIEQQQQQQQPNMNHDDAAPLEPQKLAWPAASEWLWHSLFC